VTLIDSIYNLGVVCADPVPTSLAVGANYTCNYSVVINESGTVHNVATVDTTQTDSKNDDATVNATTAPSLTIDKSNDAPSAAAGGSKPGDTVTYTLDYTVANGPVHNGIITDVLPAGLTYVSGSASSDAQFTFIDFNVTTPGALTWKAATVSANGSLTYKVTVDADAADKDQPLKNTATIDSDETTPSSDTSNVFVPAPVLAETSVPTAPRSDIGIGPENTTSGSSMLLILLALAGIALAVVFVAPTPAAIRKRKDR
jgi:uncharacterized repeat protein (TIGR01451 family)